MPSTHAYTTCESESGRWFQASYSACQLALRRRIDDGESGAPSPRSPRIASSKSPDASPCRYSCGNRSLTCDVLRANSGRIRLTYCSSVPRTRGRLTFTVPMLVESRRSSPYPLRYPLALSWSLRSLLPRPRSCLTSSSKTLWMNDWACSRTKDSNSAKVAPLPPVVSFIYGVVLPDWGCHPSL